MKYDIIIIGSGPGGYVAAIRAAQLGMKVAVVEKSELGGICLNWGCIPTKALLKSAQAYRYMLEADHYGLEPLEIPLPKMTKIVERSREVANRMSRGVDFLFKKNNIDFIQGYGKLLSSSRVKVEKSGDLYEELEADKIILATGSSPKYLSGIEADGKKIINFRQAMTLNRLPESMVIIGSGAIGCEFAYFFHSMGTKVSLVEYLPTIMPLEDEEIGQALARSFKKSKMKVMTKSAVKSVDTSGDLCQVHIETKGKEKVVEAEIVLSAVGVEANLSGFGLEELKVEVVRGKIKVDENYQTNVKGIYAIGDIIEGAALAHVASAEAINCIERIYGMDVEPIDYTNIPSAVYTIPEVASLGLTQKQALDRAYDIRLGVFPYRASGKAAAAGNTDGFVKLIFDKKTDLLLGAHLMGDNVSEIIAELVMAKKAGIKGYDIIKAIHPHPSMSEAVMEAAAVAYDEVIHL